MQTYLNPSYHLLRDTIAESFAESNDGYWYPIEATPATPALVRIILAESGYCVERRRGVESAWLPVAVVHTGEFNAAHFRTWRRSWRMVSA
jgi:hypothetical protein